MRRFVALVLLVCLPVALAAASVHDPGDAPTTIVIVRHAEKAFDDARDPSLTAAGRDRARALADVLAGADVAAVYSTQFKRTRATVAPLADRFGLEVVVRPIDADNKATHAMALAQEVLGRHRGETVVVVGHSNTVPELVQAFGGGRVDSISESTYDRLYVVIVAAPGEARVIQARYGAPTG